MPAIVGYLNHWATAAPTRKGKSVLEGSTNENNTTKFPPMTVQTKLSRKADWKKKCTRIYIPQRHLRVLVEKCRKDSSQALEKRHSRTLNGLREMVREEWSKICKTVLRKSLLS
ncbi:hypothetical protein TNCV_4197241 [Trichonephila clavipes]|nr:hypothetical protein TNCV_4197241 [Trichonephila clavipes]